MRMILAACLAAFAFRGVCSAQADPAQTFRRKLLHHRQSQRKRGTRAGRVPLPATQQRRIWILTGYSRCETRRWIESAIHITLDDGTIAFTKDVLGRITGAFFEGDGEVLLAPPTDVERKR